MLNPKRTLFTRSLIAASVLSALAGPALAEIQLDTTVGSSSFKMITLDGGIGNFDSTFEVSDRAAMDANGRLLMVGRTSPGVEQNTQLIVARRLADNSLDSSFGSNGRVTISDANYNLQGSVVSVDNQGRILVAGESANQELRLYRLLANGSLDSSFGSNGETSFNINASGPQTTSITTDSQGRVYLAGRVYTGSGTGEGNNAYIARFDANGNLDTSFNSTGYWVLGAESDDLINDLQIDADGKLLAAGHLAYVPTLFRFNQDGSMDTSLAGTGQVSVSRSATPNSEAYDLTIDTNGKILVTTTERTSDSDTTPIFNLYRYNSDGSLDTTFADNGWFGRDVANGAPSRYNEASMVELDSQNRILLAGKVGNNNETHMAMLRLTNTGQLDTSFGNNGTGHYYLEPGQANNKPLMVYQESNGNLNILSHQSGYEGHDLAWTKVDVDGHTTTPFANDGAVIAGADDLTIPFDDFEDLSKVRVDAQGRTLVVGDGKDSTKTNGDDAFVRRYNLDGSLDTSFANGGIYQVDLGTGDYIRDIQLDDSGNIWLLETADWNNTTFHLIKLTPNGQLDTSYASNGMATLTPGFGAEMMVLTSNGSILVTDSTYKTVKVLADGSQDTSFGVNGLYVPAGLSGYYRSKYLSLDSQGRIILAGTVNNAANSLVIRANADGTTDTTYASNGMLTISLPTELSRNGDANYTAALGDGDTLWLTVAANISSRTENANYVIRIDANGAVDTSFNNGTPAQLGVGQLFNPLAIQKDSAGRLVIVGWVGTDSYDLSFAARMNADGSNDETFATGGAKTFDFSGSTDFTDLAIKPNGDLVIATYLSWGNDRGMVVHLTENSAPTLSGTAATSVDQDAAYSFVPVATDAQNDGLSFSIQNKPSWANFDTTTGQLTGTPTNADVGLYDNIVITVSDGKFSTSLTAFSITVVNVNDAPAGSVNINATTSNGPVLTATNNITDVDGMGVITYHWLRSGNEVSTGEQYTLSLADAEQTIRVRADYTDAAGTAESVLSSVTTATDDFFIADADGDTLSNIEELTLGTDYNKADTDGDNINDNIDAFPLDISESVDTDHDGIGNNTDSDDDNDGIVDWNDAFPLDATESMDTDHDGIGNNADTDDDNDGIADSDDAFPLDAAESIDTDHDGIGNNADTDDDNDGVLDIDDALPLDASESVDTDGDGIGNNADTDDDNDGVLDADDAFPLNASESVDTDGDGIGNNADTDDDNDGIADSDDAFPLDAAESVDTDHDGIGNNADTDDDNDGVLDIDDALPLDASESVDTDGDGIGNNADSDDDNDGVADSDDVFPLDAAESVDTDHDGIGNNADTDDDNDGVLDIDDALPLDASESVDTDGDGIGNNADTDDDNDGVLDADDAFPLDASESVDTDGDGIGNNADTDDDNDGIADTDDSAPLDPTIGDDIAPVFATLQDLVFEAQGPTTLVTLPLPQVTDNNSNAPTVSSNLQGALPVGEHLVIWTATDFAGNQSTAEQKVSIVDTTAPLFGELTPVQINSTGRLTDISSDIMVTATDLVDGDVTAAIVGDSQRVSGQHQVELKATDAAGNSASQLLVVDILPKLALATHFPVEANGNYQLPVSLSGLAPHYPVSISYSVNVDGVAVSLLDSTITQGTEGVLAITIPSNVTANSTIDVIVDSTSNAFVDQGTHSQLAVIEQNLAPNLALQLTQQARAGQLIDPANGTVKLTATVNDVNVADTHSVSFQVVNQAFTGTVTEDGLGFEFNPGILADGSYAIDVTVTETNQSQPLSSTRRQTFVVQTLAPLSDADSDGDGIPDNVEGYSDSDGDGIADYLDNDSNTSRLPQGANSEPMQTSAGIQLSMGALVSAANGAAGNGAGISQQQLTQLLANDPTAANTEDGRFVAATTLLDFRISCLSQAGQSVPVVIPMPSGAQLPEGAVYRKYNTQQGWFNFIEDARNQISSASLDSNGFCPAPGSELYHSGLTAGDQCIELVLEDGGPNDADFSVNGAIDDPSTIATMLPNQAPTLQNDVATVVEGESVLINVLANDQDPEGDALTLQSVTTEVGDAAIAQQQIRYTAAAGTAGTVQTIQYTVVDAMGASSSALVNVTVTAAAKPVEKPTEKRGGSLPILGVLFTALMALARRRKAK